jgi:hypothetical protein
MSQARCDALGCKYKPLPLWERWVVTGIAAGAVLAKPFANALGVDLSQDIASASIVIRASAALPLLAWLGAMYLAWKEPTDNHWTAILNALGLPGLFLAFAVIVSK